VPSLTFILAPLLRFAQSRRLQSNRTCHLVCLRKHVPLVPSLHSSLALSRRLQRQPYVSLRLQKATTCHSYQYSLMVATRPHTPRFDVILHSLVLTSISQVERRSSQQADSFASLRPSVTTFLCCDACYRNHVYDYLIVSRVGYQLSFTLNRRIRHEHCRTNQRRR
jgi:hypothetical protein